MQIDREDLRRHYASLSDEELLELDPNDLTEVALECYENEARKRNLTAAPEDDSAGLPHQQMMEADADWLETAALACSFSTAPAASNACDVLRSAGIPCEMSLVEPDLLSDSTSHAEYQVVVPSALSLRAASALDKEIFNEELEASWRAHFAMLSDDELRMLKPAAICEGLLDKVERLKRAYQEELARRTE